MTGLAEVIFVTLGGLQVITSASFSSSSSERVVVASTTLPQASGSWPALKLRIPHVDGYFTGTGAEQPSDGRQQNGGAVIMCVC